MKIKSLIIPMLLGVVLLGGCGGQLAKTGWAKVTDVSHGVMRLQYRDGKYALKRVDPESIRGDSRTIAKNLFKSARYVETKQGNTLTFPCGQTLNYYDMKCD